MVHRHLESPVAQLIASFSRAATTAGSGGVPFLFHRRNRPCGAARFELRGEDFALSNPISVIALMTASTIPSAANRKAVSLDA